MIEISLGLLEPIPATGKKVALSEEVQTHSVKSGKLVALTTDGKPDAGIAGMLAQPDFPIPQG